MMKPNFNAYDSVTKPKHYQGKYGPEARRHLDWLMEEKDE